MPTVHNADITFVFCMFCCMRLLQTLFNAKQYLPPVFQIMIITYGFNDNYNMKQ